MKRFMLAAPIYLLPLLIAPHIAFSQDVAGTYCEGNKILKFTAAGKWRTSSGAGGNWSSEDGGILVLESLTGQVLEAKFGGDKIVLNEPNPVNGSMNHHTFRKSACTSSTPTVPVRIPSTATQDVHSRVTDLVNQASACKSSVAEFYASKGYLPPDSAAAGCTYSTANSSATIIVNGVITVRASAGFSAVLVGEASGSDFVLQPQCGAIVTNASYDACAAHSGDASPEIQSWLCTPIVGTTITQKYLPPSCR